MNERELFLKEKLAILRLLKKRTVSLISQRISLIVLMNVFVTVINKYIDKYAMRMEEAIIKGVRITSLIGDGKKARSRKVATK
ncbi:MAG TPA: hypothetical protein DCK87_01770 [Desulfotomaculum sp.]|nr:hypothetical protein [Desulfotomaculum sp.]